MQSLSIKAAVESDLQAFLDLGRATGEIPGLWGKNPEDNFYNMLRKMKDGKVILLVGSFGQDMIVGFVVVYMFKKLDPSGFDSKSCTVGVAVHPNFRKRGIGTKLIEHGLREAKEQGIETAYISTGIENVAMQKLAEKLGFVKYAVLERDGSKFPRYKREI